MKRVEIVLDEWLREIVDSKCRISTVASENYGTVVPAEVNGKVPILLPFHQCLLG
jgi:hypothetical protein